MPKGKKDNNLPKDAMIVNYSDTPQKKPTIVSSPKSLDGVEKKTIPLWDMPKKSSGR